jgi:hypothetical protein
MKIIEVYQITKFDGGDRHIPSDICFSSHEEAEKFLTGNLYDDYKMKRFFVYDTVEEYEESKSEKLREKALAKLTIIEQKALGLL